MKILLKETDTFGGKKVSKIKKEERVQIVEQFQARGIECIFI